MICVCGCFFSEPGMRRRFFGSGRKGRGRGTRGGEEARFDC